ncbi:hypothetical protein GCM10029976_050550 [Kribbella albertanoniae]|uniref:Fibronectin type III domain-containing protein n=1 Tax=Kribbella albertanoniae TaxID=1266829 RepID=A0A4V2XRJ5_9ACTN|nr:hypothetical protein [Kribbella albertanoniae]TDC30125.1 hypothetical protein E1261_14170 [Kribbella albertanoniae]
MRKLAATTAAAILLTTGLATPAWAALPTVPTNVRVAWVGDSIRVTWEDQGEANVIKRRYGGRSVEAAVTTAGQVNEVLLSPDFDASADVQISVVSTSDGQTSGLGLSPHFDTLRPTKATVMGANLLADLSVRLMWNRPTSDDPDPNDPLDRPDAEWFKATVTGPGAGQTEDFSIPLDPQTTGFTVPARPRPTSITVAAGNEWGTTPGDGPRVRVGTMRIGAVMPAQQVYNRDIQFGATLHRFFCACAATPDPAPIRVDLQARPNSSAPWKTVVSNSRPNGQQVPLPSRSLGSRQYRLWVPSYTRYYDDGHAIEVTAPASTSAKTSLTSAHFGKVGIFPASAPVSATVRLIVQLSPQVDMKAALQRWDGKQWRYAREVRLTKGHADIALRAAGRGTTTKYRILTPKLLLNGLPIEASTSAPFTLTVR